MGPKCRFSPCLYAKIVSTHLINSWFWLRKFTLFHAFIICIFCGARLRSRMVIARIVPSYDGLAEQSIVIRLSCLTLHFRKLQNANGWWCEPWSFGDGACLPRPAGTVFRVCFAVYWRLLVIIDVLPEVHPQGSGGRKGNSLNELCDSDSLRSY